MKIIIIYKFTKLANAPDELFSMLNKTKNDNYNIYFIFDNSKKLIELINLHSSDDIIVHFNNRRLNIDELNNKNVHKIIQYHTEPNNGKVDLNVDDSFCKLVLNQYHCTINEYKNCNYIIRNCIINNSIFDEHIYNLAREYITPDSIVLDLGSNFGQLGILFSKSQKNVDVYCFEASKYIFDILKKNIQINNSNAKPIHCIIGDKSGEKLKIKSANLQNYNTYGSNKIDIDKLGNSKDNEEVELIKIDD